MAKFEDFGLDRRITRAVAELGYSEPTPIQEKCIGVVMKGSDCVAQSSTGSGKTAAFGLPILQKITPGGGLQFAVLTPTRELCLQVKDALVQFSKYLDIGICAIYGGSPMGKQIEALSACEVMVGTPGRLLDHLKRGTLHLEKVRFLVLDEADRMLDMGFIDDVMKLTSRMPSERQTMLFSATIPDEIRNVIRHHLKEPVYVKTESYVDKSHLRQVFYPLRQEEKFSLLVHLLRTKNSGFALVFCATRRKVDALTRNLVMQGVEAVGIHGGMVQNKRLKAIDRLKRSTIHVLVATDVAARGLDIKNITHIYNYDVPKTSDEYIHRIGRTARAGADGDAITFVAQADQENFRSVLSDQSLEIRQESIPDHERLPYRAKDGGNGRRGRPEGISRTGKPKSNFSNTYPRASSHNQEVSQSVGNYISGNQLGKGSISSPPHSAQHPRAPSGHRWPQKTAVPSAHQAGGPRPQRPAEPRAAHEAPRPHYAGQTDSFGGRPQHPSPNQSRNPGRLNRRQRRLAHRSQIQQNRR